MSTVSVTNLKHESASGNNITLDSSGNVGVGTSSPGGYKLAIGDGSSNRGRIMLKGATSGNYPEINIDDTANSGKNFQVISSAGSFFVNDQTGGGLTRFKIDTSGRVTMPYQPAFRAYGTASYDSRTTPVNFETAVFNIGGHYNTSTYRFTAPVAGTYWFGVYGIAAPTSAAGGLNLRVNGSSNLRSYHLPNERTRGITGIFYLNASDYVDVGMEDLTTYYLANYAYFAGYLIG